ncbi:MAG: oligosaccharide flippase family protein, partial [Planctomycetota bacterium]
TLLVSAAFYGYQSFTVPSLCGLIPPCLIISSVLLFGHRLGIHSLAAGVMVGLLLQLGFQWYFLPKRGPKGFCLRFYHPALKKIIILMMPILLGTIIAQVNPIIQRILASKLSEGSIAAFNFAQMVGSLPLNIILSPIIMALFPFLALQCAKGETERFNASSTISLRLFNFIALPISFYLIFFSTPIIKILFEYGRFGTRDTALTAGALTYLGIGLFAGINLAFLGRAFCALQDTLTPLIASVFCALACIPLNLILVKYLDLNGLALTTSLISIICFLIIFLLFHLKVRVKGSRLIFVAFIKTLLITSVMGIISYLVYKYCLPSLALIPRLIISVLAGGIVFILLSYFIRMEEFFLLSRYLKWEILVDMVKSKQETQNQIPE